MTWRHWLGFGVLVFFWGSTWIAIRILVAEVRPLGSAAVRFAIASVLLAIVARVWGLKLGWRHQTSEHRRLIVILSFLMIALVYALVFWAEQFITAGLAAVLFATHSAFVVLVESLYRRKNTLTRVVLLGLVLSFAGLILIFWPQLETPERWVASLAMLGAALAGATSTVLAKHKGAGLHPVVGVTWQMAGGAVLLTVLAVAVEGVPTVVMSVNAWLALLYLAVFGSCVAFVLYFWLLKNLAPVQISTLAFLTPIVALVGGWVVLGESLGWLSLAGAVIALAGVALVHTGDSGTEVAGD